MVFGIRKFRFTAGVKTAAVCVTTFGCFHDEARGAFPLCSEFLIPVYLREGTSAGLNPTIFAPSTNGTAVIANFDRYEYYSHLLFSYMRKPRLSADNTIDLQFQQTAYRPNTVSMPATENQTTDPCPSFSSVSASKIQLKGVLAAGAFASAVTRDDMDNLWVWSSNSSSPNPITHFYNEFHKIGFTSNPPQANSSAIYPRIPVPFNDPPKPIWFSSPDKIYSFSNDKFIYYDIQSGLWVDKSDTYPNRPSNFINDFRWKDSLGDLWYVQIPNLEIWKLNLGSSPTSPQWINYHSLSNQSLFRYGAYWRDPNGDLYLFGGGSLPVTSYNTMYCFTMGTEPASPKLIEITKDGQWPSPRLTPTYWTAPNGDFVMYGGSATYTAPATNEFWVYTIASEPEAPRWVNKTPTNAATSYWPGNKIGASGWVASDGSLMIYGGIESKFSSKPAEIWKFGTATSSMQFTTEVDTAMSVVPPLNDPSGKADLIITVAPLHGNLSPITVTEGTAPNTTTRTTGFIYTPAANHIGEDTFTIGFGNVPCETSSQTKTVIVRTVAKDTSVVDDWGMYD